MRGYNLRGASRSRSRITKGKEAHSHETRHHHTDLHRRARVIDRTDYRRLKMRKLLLVTAAVLCLATATQAEVSKTFVNQIIDHHTNNVSRLCSSTP